MLEDPGTRRLSAMRPGFSVKGLPMAYCDRCGTYAALDAAAMCDNCRASWRPSAPVPGDLGSRAQPQPSGPGEEAASRPVVGAGSLTRSDLAAQHDVASPWPAHPPRMAHLTPARR